MPCQQFPKNQPPKNSKGGPFETKEECESGSDCGTSGACFSCVSCFAIGILPGGECQPLSPEEFPCPQSAYCSGIYDPEGCNPNVNSTATGPWTILGVQLPTSCDTWSCSPSTKECCTDNPVRKFMPNHICNTPGIPAPQVCECAGGCIWEGTEMIAVNDPNCPVEWCYGCDGGAPGEGGGTVCVVWNPTSGTWNDICNQCG